MAPRPHPPERKTRLTLRALTSIQAIDKSRLDADERAGLDAFVTGIRRRWGLIVLVTVFGFAAVLLDMTPIAGPTVWAIGLVFAAINFSLSAIPRATGYRAAYLHSAFALDLMVLATPLTLVGSGGLAGLILVGLVPYASGDTPRVRIVHAVAGGVAAIGGLALYSILSGGQFTSGLTTSNLFGAGGVVAAGLIIRWREATRLTRITDARKVIETAESGALYNRIPIETDDELAHMTSAVNAMMARVSLTIAEVQHEAREVSAFAEMLSHSSRAVLSSTRSVLDTTRSLASELDDQRKRAEDGHDRTTDAAAAAAALRDGADRMAEGVQQLMSDAQLGRERVQRASETLIAIAEDVRTTATTIHSLSNMSDDIGNFVHTTSRMARQTHVLALNAAIEAAHSGTGQEGFSAVAEEVRSLAATSGDSARSAAELIEDVRAHIEAVARSVGAGEQQVRDVGAVAAEAKQALDALVRGASDVSALVRTTADVSRSQADRMTTLAGQMLEIASVNARTSTDAQGAAKAMDDQQVTMTDLNTAATQLAILAERLADSVNRFQVKAPDQDTAEFQAMNRDL